MENLLEHGLIFESRGSIRLIRAMLKVESTPIYNEDNHRFCVLCQEYSLPYYEKDKRWNRPNI